MPAYPSQSVIDHVEQRRKANPSLSGAIEEVLPGSLADRLGIRVGDRLLSMDGEPVLDTLDVMYRAASSAAVLTLERPGTGAYEVTLPEEPEPLGLGFANELFDRIRTCDNNCPFCFVYQLPKRMRSSLYVKDDDFRLSFTHGNYVTLTNLSAEDWARIKEQRLSPLYVSVHATDPDTRIRLLGGNPKGGRILEELRELTDAGIRMHCQVVFCPRINDGEVLKKTLLDLADLHPGALDVAIVPVAIGDHLKANRQLWPVTPQVAEETIAQVSRLQRRFRRGIGTPFAYLADEFYFLAGRPLPGHGHYREYALLEDGIGLARLWQQQWKRARRRLPEGLAAPHRVALATATMGAEVLAETVADLNRVEGLAVEMVTVPNRHFGEAITVAGLMTGGDLRREVAQLPYRPDEVWLPEVALRDGVFLDDVRLEDLRRDLGLSLVALPSEPKSMAARVRHLASHAG
ncbi:MAG TPA: DUF512 domain-containing protein [Armatimonadota bacterium]